jgi:hypothetical protein
MIVFHTLLLAVGSWQLAVGSWQLAVGSWQLAVGSWQLAELYALFVEKRMPVK